MSRAYDIWIYQQENPDDILIVGNRKRWKMPTREVIPPRIVLTEEESDRKNDEYLAWCEEQLKNRDI